MKEPLFAFVIPLRRLSTSHIARQLIALLNCTLSSANRSIYPRHATYVIGNGELQTLASNDVRTINIEDLRRGSGDLTGYADMHNKRMHGACLAVTEGADYVIFLDADDLVHRDLLSHIAASALTDSSWLSCRGWEYMHRFSRMFYRADNFHVRCGSCAIVSRLDLISTFNALDPATSPEAFYHHNIISVLANAGRLPFPAFVYRTDHGGNITLGLKDVTKKITMANCKFLMRYLAKLLLSKPFSLEHAKQFGVVTQSDIYVSAIVHPTSR